MILANVPLKIKKKKIRPFDMNMYLSHYFFKVFNKVAPGFIFHGVTDDIYTFCLCICLKRFEDCFVNKCTTCTKASVQVNCIRYPNCVLLTDSVI
jgi:hypothetical protein